MESKEIKSSGLCLSEESKKALQSETWKQVEREMKKRVVKHFTAENTIDSAYGWTWNQVVQEYLQTKYKEDAPNAEITVSGAIYKILRRPEVTAFYDADGDTLFDVTNDRLEREYEFLVSNDAVENAESTEIVQECKEVTADTATEPVKTVEKSKSKMKVKYSGIEGAITKLREELKKAEQKEFAELIIEYLIDRCKESESLAMDICQPHKAWEKCFNYIFDQAKGQTKGNYAAIRDNVVFEWAEDYYRKDDKAEEEKKALEKAKAKKSAAEKKSIRNTPKNLSNTNRVESQKKINTPKVPQKTKKSNKEMEGQMDLFSLMSI